MIIDSKLELANSQALTTTAASTNVIDQGVARDLAAGEPMALVVQCDVAMGGTSPTLDIKIQKDTAAAFSSPTDVISYPQLSAMAAGAQVVLPLPVGDADEQYLRAYFTLGGTTPTVTLSAFIVPMSHISKYVAYPNAANA